MAPQAGFWHYAVLAEDDRTTEASQRGQAALLTRLLRPARWQPKPWVLTGLNSLIDVDRCAPY